jgi:thiamine transport system ATP-binding protein
MLTLDDVVAQQGDFTLTADLSIPMAARVAVIGPSGSGKSTLMNLVAGFLPLTSGRMAWDGQDLSRMTPGDRPLSIVFQDSNLFPHLTVAENVGLGIRPRLRLSREEQDRIEAALSRVGLGGYGARKPAALSGGQQSRVALARVLLRKRPLLLLDEPFAALGPALRQEMLELVAEIATQEQLTVLMVTHEPQDARALTELSVFVEEGVAHVPTATGALLDNPPQALKDYLGT